MNKWVQQGSRYKVNTKKSIALLSTLSKSLNLNDTKFLNKIKYANTKFLNKIKCANLKQNISKTNRIRPK